ncbi:I78 family peptidase inhibitor [Luteimonas abyssi]|uniref:I78 family peptidase inhibitor n=1 Tax=Luteimonas abyssi TaxID=1247514 RepID=UPI000737BF21|nr:I78 family peptidase inhibitor [Luteimonas abyssi]
MTRIASAALTTLAALALTACASSHDGGAATPEAPSDDLAQCDAARAQSLVGQPSSDAVLEQARAATGASSLRALKPDDMATMDYRPDRLNVMLDDAGVVTSFRCG